MNKEASSFSWFHDVFISSIEEYTTKSFTDYLYNALEKVNLRFFRNGQIGTERLKALERSRSTIILFSMNYVCSTCYLDELVKILQYRKTIGQIVLPIFYDVDPSDIRKQSGSIAEAFAEFEESFKLDTTNVQRWREALTEAADLSGWDLRDVANGPGSKFTNKIIEEVLGLLARLNQNRLDIAPSLPWFHDVFISSMEEYTTKSFTDHLYTTLVQAKIHTFRNGQVCPERLKAIEESKIAIIIFSRSYVCSTWYLDELAKILECRKTVGQPVLPIFYDVDPSDVQKQNGSLAEAFAKFEETFKLETGKVQRWREALTEAANLSWWDLRNVINGHASKFINKIIEDLSAVLNHKQLYVARYLVGMDSHLEKVNSLLSIGSSDIRIIGICGMSGIGKTAIAKAVYNFSFHRFAGSSFLANVSEVSKQANGLIHLQEQLLSDILMKKNIRITDVSRGINVIRNRLQYKKVLVILDDVDNSSQINALVGNRAWFGAGSRIILTTRDEHIINQSEAFERYHVEELNPTESLQLFSLYAFGTECPTEDYVGFSVEMVRDFGGIPLALETLGTFLSVRCKLHWRNEINMLKRILYCDIKEKLLTSFVALDDMEKDIFLDVACFFVGMNRDDVISILDGCNLFPAIGITLLIYRSLLAITQNNVLWMHLLFQQMGRQIVCEESIDDPGKRSRLCSDEAYDVLTKCSGTKAVEGLALDLSKLKIVCFNTEAFAKMNKLRLLQINYVHLQGDYKHISRELRWLCWHGCPLKSIPADFHMGNLVFLDMQHSNIRKFSEESKLLKRLKVLNLSHSPLLERTNFITFPNLEKLILEDCNSLVGVHQSIGYLDKLVLLNLQDCRSLENLPVTICFLRSLEILSLSGCSKLDKLPEELGTIGSLKELLADRTAIKQLPFSIRHIWNLKSLSLGGCKVSPPKSYSFSSCWGSPSKGHDSINLLQASFSLLWSLKCLNLRDCNLSEGAIPCDLGTLSSLEELDPRYNNLSKASKQIFLQALPKGGELNIFLPGSAIPEWFSHQSLGSSLSLEVPHLPDYKIQKLIACAVYAAEEFYREDYGLADAPFLNVNNKTKCVKWRYCPTPRTIPLVHQDHMWVGCIPATEFGNLFGGGDEVEVSIEMKEPIKMTKCGIILVIDPYEESSGR